MFRGLSLVGLAGLITYVLSQEGSHLLDVIGETIAAAGMLVGLAMAAGYGVGLLTGGDSNDRFTLLIEFAVRSVAIATAIAVTVLGGCGVRRLCHLFSDRSADPFASVVVFRTKATAIPGRVLAAIRNSP
jgi:hypothetical protein